MERAKLESVRAAAFQRRANCRLHENRLRANRRWRTPPRALKEHFILERIAEEEKIEDTPDDYESEIELIAAQSGESPRRVRAQLERQDLMDVLRNQIVENKTIKMILDEAKFKDVPFVPEKADSESLDLAISGDDEESEIPEAKHGGEAGAPTLAGASRVRIGPSGRMWPAARKQEVAGLLATNATEGLHGSCAARNSDVVEF